MYANKLIFEQERHVIFTQIPKTIALITLTNAHSGTEFYREPVIRKNIQQIMMTGSGCI